MAWNKVNDKNDYPKVFGWYAVALNPVNQDEFIDEPTRMNSWRESFGYSKVWYNDNDFYEPNSHGFGNDVVTKRVTHWDELPSVPLFTK
jgi:hypothetical protein